MWRIFVAEKVPKKAQHQTFQDGRMSLTKVVRGAAKTAKAPYGAHNLWKMFKNFISLLI